MDIRYITGIPLLFTGYNRFLEWVSAHLLTCPSRRWLHMQCPGCGFQRSFIALLGGDFRSSFILYPALVPFLVLLTLTSLHLVFRFRHGATMIKYCQLFVAIVVAVSYIYKVINHQIFA